MANSLNKSRRLRLSSSDYEVGYGKPPKSTRFKPGQSGNPRGRRKGVPNKPLPIERLRSIIHKEAYRKITVNDGDRRLKMTVAEAAMRSLGLAAAKGQPRAQKLLTELLILMESKDSALNSALVETMIQIKMKGEQVLEAAKRANVDPPELLPHPDHIILDIPNGRVYVVGPSNKEEKALFDWLRQEQADAQRELAELEAKLEEAADPQARRKILKDIRSKRKQVAVLNSLYRKNWGQLP
jgi:hypothetical protein